MSYHVQILAENQLVYCGEIDGELELGRQRNPQEAQLTFQRTEQGGRLAIAPLDENQIGRRQLMIRQKPAGKVEVSNISPTVAVEIVGGMRLDPSATQIVSLPTSILFPAGRTITVSGETPPKRLNGLEEATVAPGHSNGLLSTLSQERLHWRASEETEDLVQALRAVMDVFQSAHSPEELFASAIRGAVALAGFDRAQILLSDQGNWKPVDPPTDKPWRVSQTVLRSVAEQKRTFWETEVGSLTEVASLMESEAVIATATTRG